MKGKRETEIVRIRWRSMRHKPRRSSAISTTSQGREGNAMKDIRKLPLRWERIWAFGSRASQEGRVGNSTLDTDHTSGWDLWPQGWEGPRSCQRKSSTDLPKKGTKVYPAGHSHLHWLWSWEATGNAKLNVHIQTRCNSIVRAGDPFSPIFWDSKSLPRTVPSGEKYLMGAGGAIQENERKRQDGMGHGRKGEQTDN